MNKREAKKLALDGAIAVIEQWIAGGGILDSTANDKDAEKLEVEVENIIKQLRVKRQKFAD